MSGKAYSAATRNLPDVVYYATFVCKDAADRALNSILDGQKFNGREADGACIPLSANPERHTVIAWQFRRKPWPRCGGTLG